MLQAMYNSISYRVKLKDFLSEDFFYSIGLRQGCVLSPLLFNFFIDGIVKIGWIGSRTSKNGKYIQDKLDDLWKKKICKHKRIGRHCAFGWIGRRTSKMEKILKQIGWSLKKKICKHKRIQHNFFKKTTYKELSITWETTGRFVSMKMSTLLILFSTLVTPAESGP